MADNSVFNLHWKIDNATATLATGRAESGVFNRSGFKWRVYHELYYTSANKMQIQNAEIIMTAAVNRRGLKLDLNLQCDLNGHNKCEVDIRVFIRNGGGYKVYDLERFCFEDDKIWKHQSDEFRMDSLFNGNISIEFFLCIINKEMQCIESKFSAPNRMSNVILTIGEKKLHISKELLAFHSPFFETLFFGDFAENGKEEVEIKDVVYEEFLDLLNLIHFGTLGEILVTPLESARRALLNPTKTDHTISHILKLSDQFQMENILKKSKKHLIQSKEIDVVKKFQLADQYSLVTLRDHCLHSCTKADLVGKVKSSSEYENFSDGMKTAICDRIMDISD